MFATEKSLSKYSDCGKSPSDLNKQAVPTDSRQEQIAVTTHLLAEERSLTPGLELQDWLEAECNVLERFPG